MRERGILMSAPMVRALLAGKKTQTRRLVKPAGLVEVDGDGRPFTKRWDKEEGIHWRRGVKCPYGIPGDRLWVRETWCESDGHVSPKGETCYRANLPTPEYTGWKWRITARFANAHVRRYIAVWTNSSSTNQCPYWS